MEVAEVISALSQLLFYRNGKMSKTNERVLNNKRKTLTRECHWELIEIGHHTVMNTWPCTHSHCMKLCRRNKGKSGEGFL